MSVLRVGIVGAGGMGQKRAAALGPEASLVAVADADHDRARALGLAHGAAHTFGGRSCWADLLALPDVDAVIVATPHVALAPISIAALRVGKHVLVEKPAGLGLDDVRGLVRAARESPAVIRVGCNHRFHPGLQEMKALLDKDAIGAVLNIRARYGHGGRPGYEREWRANPSLSGGGELVDQGVHLIDLCNWLGPFWDLDWGSISTQFWNMPVEDNALIVLRHHGRRAVLSLSCTEWKNTFEFEVFGTKGKLQVTGLGRSYGIERLRYIELGPAMWPPLRDETIDYRGEDRSWRAEWLGFVKVIESAKGPVGPGPISDNATAEDAERAMKIVHGVYEMNKASWLMVRAP